MSTTQHKLLGDLIARCWTDDAFRQRLMAHPKEVLVEHGIHIRDGVEVKVLENTPNTEYLVIPPKPPLDATSLATPLDLRQAKCCPFSGDDLH